MGILGSAASLFLRRPIARRVAVGIVAAALGGLTINCTLVTARTDGQCFNDAECRARGADFAQTVCSAVGTCEVVTLPEAGADAGGPCKTNLECNVSLSTKARCASGECVALTNPQCTAVDGDPTAPDAIFVGVMTPRSGQNQPYGLNQYQVAVTAASEWARATTGQTGTHPIVTIGCDEIADPVGTATFLASTVQVPAIFGPIYDADFEQAVPVAAANGTFLLGPRVDDPNLSTLSGVGKDVWSWAPNRSIQVKYFQSLINFLEPSVKAMFDETADGGVKDMKVAFAVSADLSSTNFANAVEPTLTFNGKTATSQNGTNYTRISIPFSFSTANDYTSAVTSLVSFQPDLVIVSQEYELLNFVRAINSGWPSSSPKFPRFLFLSEDSGVDNEVALANERFAGKLDFTTWSRNSQEQSNALAFAVSYRSVAGTDPAPLSELLYDAFYENLYAFQAALDTNGNLVSAIDTGTYATAIQSFNAPGTLVNVGPTDVPTMLTLLSAGGDADLEGASGPLEMNATGGSPAQGAVLECAKAGGTITPSGVTFDGQTGAATGSYSCL